MQSRADRRQKYAWFDPPIYSDESYERYEQVFSEVRRDSKTGVKQFVFWSAVCFVLIAIVWAKLYTTGAVIGLK